MASISRKTVIPTGDLIPDVYRDLQSMSAKTALLELPTDQFAFYPMYFSTYHLKNIANGRSGFIPPVTEKLNLLTGRQWVDAFSPALLEHLLQTGVNTILVKRAKIEPIFRRTILHRLSRWNCLRPIREYPNRDLLFGIDAVLGNKKDVQLARRMNYSKGNRLPLNLPGEDAFQVYLGRQTRREVIEGNLCLYERNHLRWFLKIPSGIWRIELEALNSEYNRTSGQHISINMRLGEKPVLEKILNMENEVLLSRPVRISRTAHYAIDCLILPGHPQEALALVLSDVKLTPLVDDGLSDK